MITINNTLLYSGKNIKIGGRYYEIGGIDANYVTYRASTKLGVPLGKWLCENVNTFTIKLKRSEI